MADDNEPKVEWIKDLISYQDGSIVSREIIRKSYRNCNIICL
jgi:hypothetical protein